MYNPDIHWEHQIVPTPLEGLLSFDTMFWGLRAGLIDAKVKVFKDGLDTLETFIPKFCPPDKNDTDKYVINMRGWLNMKPGDKIRFEKIADYYAWAHGVCRQELGLLWAPKNEDIAKAAQAAMDYKLL